MINDIIRYKDGIFIHGDCTTTDVFDRVKSEIGLSPLIVTDPPYGNIVDDDWDKTEYTEDQFVQWMYDWTNQWKNILYPNAAFYIWGCIGIPRFRPYLKYLSGIEHVSDLTIANVITWKKKRAYGLKYNYLFTREECVYLINGNNIKAPRCFNIPYLNELRGYAGYNKKYPAKSKYKRRSNVWTDITEIFRGKKHSTQKQQRLYEVAIETHTHPQEYVVDMFAGAGTCALACRKLNRRFVIIEKDKACFETIIKLLD